MEHGASHAAGGGDLRQTVVLRDLFWRNVVREMLTTLSMLRPNQPEMFDGRIGVLTNHGERIGIADVVPMFACGIPGSSEERALSMAVECTVFKIRTPDGEVFTLPISEVRGFHTLTEELLRSMEKAAQESMRERGGVVAPFGFAAFRSMPLVGSGLGEEAGDKDEEGGDEDEQEGGRVPGVGERA